MTYGYRLYRAGICACRRPHGLSVTFHGDRSVSAVRKTLRARFAEPSHNFRFRTLAPLVRVTGYKRNLGGHTRINASDEDDLQP